MNTTENNNSANALIAEFMGRFVIDRGGNIYNKKGLKMKTSITKNGYEKFNTSRPTKSFLVHRLVAISFIENTENKPEVNHKDGNKLNNNVSNLEWVSRSENIIHGFEHNLISKDKDNKGVKHYRSIPIKATDYEGNAIHYFNSSGEANRLNNFSSQSIRDAIKGKLKTYKGLYWSIDNENK